MSSKLSYHIIGDPTPAFDDIRASGAKVVKVMDFESRETLAALKAIVPFVIYRKYMDGNYDTLSPQAFADALPVKVYGLGMVFEGINEPVISTVEQAVALSNWYVTFADIMHTRGERVAAYSFSTGNPSLDLVPYLADGLAACDYLAVHEYLHPTGTPFDQIGRYSSFLDALPATARRQVLITETGCDSGGCKECGWNGPNWKLKSQQYLDMLETLDGIYADDDWLVAATVFSYGGGWKSFELAPISKSLSRQIAAAGGGEIPVAPHAGSGQAPPPSPAPVPPQPHPPTPSVFAEGIDVSHWQGVMEWTKAKAAGASFAFIKATDGATVIDARFAENWAGAKAAGLLRGAYHYFRNGVDALAQADQFVNTVRAAHGSPGDYGELPFALDYEDTAKPPDVTQARLFLARVQERTAHPCLIYTGKWYWQFGAPVAWAGAYDLWIATYGAAPALPPDWQDWTFWQYSSSGKGPDYGAASALIDLDRFHGDLAALQAYATKVVWGAEPTPMPTGSLELTWSAGGIQELYLDGKGIVGQGSVTLPVTADAEHVFKVVAKK